MSPSSNPMAATVARKALFDKIMVLHDGGMSPKQVSEVVGETRNKVIGMIWRAKRGRPPATRIMPTFEQMREAYERHGGILTHAAAELGIHRNTLVNNGFRTKLYDRSNRATDPDTHALIEAIDASGLTDEEIVIRVDMSPCTLYNWRAGRRKGQKFLMQCVWSVLERDKKNAPGS